MSHQQSNENQAQAEYTVLNMVQQPDLSQNKVLQVIQNAWNQNGRSKFVIIALGIFMSFLVVGLCQEKIMKTPYGDDKEEFTFANTLVEVSLLSGFIFINIWTLFQPHKKDPTPLGYYIIAAVANVLAMITSYMALRWVSFPTQIIFKSAKPISVMLFGLLICKRYTIQRYFFVLIIVVGVVVFQLYEPKEPKELKDPISSTNMSNVTTETKASDVFPSDYYQTLGISLLCLSLCMDGLLGMIQDKVRIAHKPTSQQMMLSMSAWASAILFVVLIVSGELVQVYHFACRHPELLLHMSYFGLAHALGQVFIYAMISSFGSLPNSVTSTVRKFFSVVCSIIYYNHPSTLFQWLGAVLVFTALLGDAFFGKKELSLCSNKDEADNETPTSLNSLDKTKEIVSQHV